MQMFSIRHNVQNTHHKVQPHSHPQGVVFQLNKWHSVTTSRSVCNQPCKPRVETVPGFRIINRPTPWQTSVKTHVKSVCILLTHSKLVYNQYSKCRKPFLYSSYLSEKYYLERKKEGIIYTENKAKRFCSNYFTENYKCLKEVLN